jgi:hypothetical protein
MIFLEFYDTFYYNIALFQRIKYHFENLVFIKCPDKLV